MMDRLQLLRIALIAQGLTVRAFCQRINVSPTVLYEVIAGTATSARVSEEIERAISEGLRRLRPYLEEESTPQ